MKKKIINENQYQSISMQVLFQFVEYFRYLEFEGLPEAKGIERLGEHLRYASNPTCNLTTYKARSYIYIFLFIYLFIFVPVWQKNNMSVTPVSQANCQNFCPISSLGFTKAYQWIKG